ncbi:site-2 protease family protein [Marinithermus hydrothermalis]|uniref:Peptidase M50 n=1 Tax=Marinithermus hydrothermalis (strain DSM 14884 / JCM 11576 / T1) TaxID=869210 RepID=F2NQN9_MARHT|nr:site-2 protease family protein [Marinithermus hydrothermalis]AEB11977.1 peptidase M50 [Marinithermus hydrothermalis DSM 14884]
MGLIGLLANGFLVFVVAFAASVFGLVVHNLAQAWLADRYGDSGPRRYGFLTLEPRVHLDPLGLLLLLLLGFGWPRFVPFRVLRGNREAWVALMGPVGFLLAAFVYLLISALLPRTLALDQVGLGLQFAALIMVRHAAVYLFPVPPLDGARALYAVGGYEVRRFLDRIGSYGPIGFLVIFLVLSFTGFLGAVERGLLGLLLDALRALGL